MSSSSKDMPSDNQPSVSIPSGIVPVCDANHSLLFESQMSQDLLEESEDLEHVLDAECSLASKSHASCDFFG